MQKWQFFHNSTSRSGDGFVTTNVSRDLRIFWILFDLLRKHITVLCDVCFLFFEYKKFATYVRKIQKISLKHLESGGRIRNYECVPRSQDVLELIDHLT